MKSVGGDVIEKEFASSAISLLQILPNIDLIICREEIGREKSASLIAQFLIKEQSTIPLLVIGNISSDYKQLFSISADQSWKNVVTTAGRILGVDVAFADNKFIGSYVPVGIHYFLNLAMTDLNCDIYLRLKKSETEFQYIKRLYAGDQFSKEDIEKYQEGGLKEFYITKAHFAEFVNLVTSKLSYKLGRFALEGEERLRVTSDAYEVTRDRIHSLGIDDYTVEIVEESIKSMESSLNENNALGNFLKMLRSNKLSYAYAHSFLISLVLHKIVNHFDWESAQIKEKLTYIAYFHDMSLQDIEWMKINSEAELENKTLTKEEKRLILNHASESANLVERFPKIPNGVGTILREHHGSKAGVGFPEVLSISIAPISMMFIVVEHFVDEFLKVPGTPQPEDFKSIFNKLSKRYNKITYEQTLLALENMIQRK